MIRILLCDDQQNFHCTIQELLKKYEIKYNKKCEFVGIYSAQELIEYNKDFDILLLDIDLDGKDGIKTANERFGDNARNIIILTAFNNRFKDAFKLGAFRYVTKPIDEDEFFEAINSCILSENIYDDIVIYNKGIECTIKQDDILFIEAKGGFIRIYYKDTFVDTFISMKNLLSYLDSSLFIRTHNKYIVNIKYVCNVNINKLKLINGIELMVSRRNYKDVKSLYINYDLNHERLI